MNREFREVPVTSILKERRLRASLFSGAEGLMLKIGLCLGVLYILWLSLMSVRDPERSRMLVVLSATQILFGRAAGMSFGYAMHQAHTLVIPLTLLLESVMVLLFYPLFVFSWKQLLVIRSLRKAMDRARNAAEKNRESIRRYGLIGLFLFVWFPIWMTGPMVGCVIGYLLGFRPWTVLFIVLGATSLAIVCWAFVLRSLHRSVAAYSPFAPLVFLLILVGVVLAVYLLRNLAGRRRFSAAQQDDSEHRP